MTVEKSYMEFIILHEKKLMTNEINSLEKEIISITNRASSVLGSLADKDLDTATDTLLTGITTLKKVLTKHELYDI